MRSASSRPLSLGRWIGTALLALGLAAAGADAEPRLVAVGDVHGDLTAFRAILAQAGLIREDGSWSGGDAELVQLGDLIDRGPSTRGVLDFAMALEKDAVKSGGSVVILLGNHEVMNLTGDLRYVPAESFAEFADADSAKRREAAWTALQAYVVRRAGELGRPGVRVGPDEKEAWLAAHPPGFLERQEAFGPDGVYGRWLREKSAVRVVQKNAFVHGGVSPVYAKTPAAELDRLVHADLALFDAERREFVKDGLILPFFNFVETTRAVREQLDALAASGKPSERRNAYEKFLDFGRWTMNSEDGPLWFRGYDRWSDAEGAVQMPPLLSAEGVERFVVGHTVQPGGRVRARFDNRVFLIDTGMLDSKFFPGGRASALEMSEGAIDALYPGEKPEVLQAAPVRKAAALR